ncbi:choice-of-anchor D domain [Sphingobacteriales bacterium UPWRP_1]|nr:hypothetical protein BVG80_07990 [Sphingobacteriales bacterium TSM_CSM]PSJ78424.1 choice-of-anchor D domain [Sphingobacteriales bacterium UPWRP_1]
MLWGVSFNCQKVINFVALINYEKTAQMLRFKPKQQKTAPVLTGLAPEANPKGKKLNAASLYFKAFLKISTCFILFLLLSVLDYVQAQTVGFGMSSLAGTGLNNPTSLQFGPDGRLYVAQQNGIIKIFTVQRVAANNYQITASQQIDIIAQMPNRNDDGTLNSSVWGRQVTGILVTGTAQSPIIYICSSDPRIGAGPTGEDSNLDTNSGILSRLNWTGTQWVKTDLVRGLPRSEENHGSNGMQLNAATNTLYVTQGGHTNMGALSANFSFHPEYAYSTAILAVNLTAIGNSTYDLPTLDDEDRSNTGTTAGFTDPNDPFGGNDGKNQAMLVPNGPVQIYSSGYRNPYDLVITTSGKMYTFDNGPNSGWGGPPASCIYSVVEPGTSQPDQLHLVTQQGFYAGHPNLTRANRNNTFNITNPQSPIPAGMENPAECNYLYPGTADGSLLTIPASTNGLTEYTASNFGNNLKNNLLAVSWNNKVYRIQLNAAGTAVVPGGATELFSGLSSLPLDVVAQGDAGPFPGTVWTANVFGNEPIYIFEPNDYAGSTPVTCDPNNLPATGDADNDGYSNTDEQLNGTNPCSAASKPRDNDNDLVSDLVDTDDDNDGIPDLSDAFAIDNTNGINRVMPFSITWDNDGSTPGGIYNTGFTGLMTNGTTNYLNQYNIDQMTIGGAAGVLTVDNVPEGDALGFGNTQQYAFQTGVNVQGATTPYCLHTRIKTPFAGFNPANNQSMGVFIGTGNQSNYIKIATAANGGFGGIQIVKEQNDVVASSFIYWVPILNANWVDLYLIINPVTLTVQPAYSINSGARTNLGAPFTIPASWLQVAAIGIIATSSGPGSPFPAAWDLIELKTDPLSANGVWQTVNCNGFPACSSQLTARRDNGFVQSGNQFILLGGRGSSLPVNRYNPSTNVWSNGAAPPVELHHFQAVEMNGLVYAPCAFTGNYPNETPVADVYYYDPVANTWGISTQVPQGRRRGAAGAVAYNGKIYVVGGITNGHVSGWVPWFDSYNPATNTWTSLPDAPRARTHFNAIVKDNKLYVIGGHLTGAPGTAIAPIAEVDVYDFTSGSWSTLPPSANLPTPRWGTVAGTLGTEIMVIGGQSPTAANANTRTEALDINTNTWRTLTPMLEGRHGTQAISAGNAVYVAAGSANAAETANNANLESLNLFSAVLPGGTATVKGNFSASPASAAFGYVATGASVTQTISLSNASGNQALVISSLTISGSAAFSVSAPNTLPLVIAPGQQVSVLVVFAPATTGAHNATLTINNTGAITALTIPLSGNTETFATRINSGGNAFTTTDGKNFIADTYFTSSSSTFTTWLTTPIANTTDDALYQTLRSGYANGLTYAIPVPQTGYYTVKLHFAELQFAAAGQRVFDVNIEGGNLELNDYDIYADAGANSASVKTFNGIAVTDGILTINFTAVINAATIAAIEVIAEAGGIAPVTQPVLLVTKSTTLNTGDAAVKMRLENSGYTVVAQNQSVANASSATGKSLVVISASADASVVASKFKNVTVPVLSWEAWIYDDMSLTSTLSGTHYGQTTTNQTQVAITNAAHPMAAGLSGTVPVYTTGNRLMWGQPNANAITIATVSGVPSQAVIFGYEAGAAMNGGFIAPARRVGFFLNANSAGSLNTNGWALFDAAVCWAINCSGTPPPPPPVNTPPQFTVSPVSVTVNANFATPQVITVTPAPVPPAEVSQTVTYTLSPASVNFAIVNINNATGQVTITAMLNAYGTQTFTIIANDGQAANNTATQSFTLTVNQPSGNNTTTIRINCGGPALSTSGGQTFSADAAFAGGSTSLTTAPIANTTDDLLYQSERYGWANDLAYNIPVPLAGTYSVKLHFAEIFWTAANQRKFDVNIEGGPAELTNFDIIAQSGGPNTAIVKQFDNISVTDGILNIQFTAIVNAAKISAIEVLGQTSGGTTGNTPPTFVLSPVSVTVPANFTTPQVVSVIPNAVPPAEAGQVVTYTISPASVAFANVSINSSTGLITITSVANQFGTQTFTVTANDGQAANNIATQTFTLTVTQPTGGGSGTAIRINCGGSSFTDSNGNTFAADAYFAGDGSFATLSAIAGTVNDALYQTERYGWSNNLAYNIPVPVAGYYTVKLHFAEIYWTAAGQRVFNVNIEGGPAELTNFDIIAQTGAPNTAIIKEFSGIFVNDGMLNINFSAVVNAAKIAAIEVISQGTAGGPASDGSSSGKQAGNENPAVQSGISLSDEAVLAYPNPFVNEIFVQLAPEITGLVKISLCNVQGQAVWQQTVNKQPGQHVEIVHAEGLLPGFYLLRAASENGSSTTKKLVKY